MNDRYQTSNFYLAAFLYAKGIELSGIDRATGSRRAVFLFAESPFRKQTVRDFNFAPENDAAAAVDARKLIYAIKALKEKLYQD